MTWFLKLWCSLRKRHIYKSNRKAGIRVCRCGASKDIKRRPRKESDGRGLVANATATRKGTV